MYEVIVKLDEWKRGKEPKIGSFLYDPEIHKRCCLGFACNSVGLEDKILTHISTPASLRNFTDNIVNSPLAFLVNKVNGEYINSSVCHSMMLTNDSRDTNDEEKMRELNRLAEPYDVKFVFV